MNNVIQLHKPEPARAIWCVIRGIPNSDSGADAAHRIRRPGFETRKRGRGARVHPTNWRGDPIDWGGEYQDLPVIKNGERYAGYFSFYVTTRNPAMPYKADSYYYQFAGFHHDGRLRIRPLTSEEYYHG